MEGLDKQADKNPETKKKNLQQTSQREGAEPRKVCAVTGGIGFSAEWRSNTRFKTYP